MYHRIAYDQSEKRFTVSPENFEQQVKFLVADGYRGVGLDTLVNALDGNDLESLPSKPVLFTFDDGFQESIDYACPILNRFNMPATFFLISGLMGKSNEWMRREGYRPAPLIGWSEARNLLTQGFEVGSHSVSHPDLSDLNLSAVKREIEESKTALEDRLGIGIKFFAYPYGRFNRAVQESVHAAGYAAACSTQAGFNSGSVDRFALRRLDVFGAHTLKTFRRNLTFGENEMTMSKLLSYYLRRATARVASLVH